MRGWIKQYFNRYWTRWKFSVQCSDF